VEVGCSSGALAREYKKINDRCRYIGVDVMSQYIPLARRYCDSVLEMDIEAVDEDRLRESLPGDCWIFGDTLEHLRDPWALLGRIRNVIAADGCIVACIPNAQHWSVQARLNCGEFRYEESGLMDRTHLRWFTRETILEMFQQAGFRIEKLLKFNRAGVPAWWLNGKMLRRTTFGMFQIRVLNVLTPIFRRIDALLPFPPLSIIAIFRKDDARSNVLAS